MGRFFVSLAALLAAASALQPAAAQNATGSWNTAMTPATPAPVGFEVSPGVVFVPTVFSEIGYDSNPNQSFFDQKGSGFIRSGAGFSMSSVTPGMVATVNAAGSMLDYFDSPLYGDSVRFAGLANGSVSYLIQPGATFSSGAFINYDAQSINRNQTDGANAELAFSDPLISSIFRARVLDIQYLNGTSLIASPIFLTPAFDYTRTEGTWTGVFARNWPVAPYLEISAARVQYTDQPAPSLVNRSADDYHLKTGVRWTVSPTVTADVGWRFNERNTEDRFVPSYNSNFFDGGFVWQPSPTFLFQANVERFIGEPSTNFAVLADVRSYSAKATYLPVPGVSVSAAGGWQVVNDIGSGVHYQAPFANAQIGWAYNNHVTLYTTLQYQGYDLDWQNLAYNDVRVMAGLRLVPDGQNLLEGESLDSLIARLKETRVPANSEVSVSGGYSWFGLPDLKMVTQVGGPFFDQAIGQEKNGDGSLNGWRTDARFSNVAQGTLPWGAAASFGLSGFFANYQGTTDSHCMFTATTDCAIVNVADFSSTLPNNTGPFGNLFVSTDRNVNYWGVAVDGRGGGLLPGLKDGGAAQEASPLRLGVSIRGIDETAKLNARDPLVPSPVNYSDTLNTHYYGGYVGYERKEFFGGGWMASVDATAGLYYTDTRYQGRYSGYTAIVPAGYFAESGWVNYGTDRASFIGSLRLDMKRQLGWGTVGLYGQGEYLSYVPQVLYNNSDLATGVIWGGIRGNQVGTHISSTDAFNLTAGIDLSVPLN